MLRVSIGKSILGFAPRSAICLRLSYRTATFKERSRYYWSLSKYSYTQNPPPPLFVQANCKFWVCMSVEGGKWVAANRREAEEPSRRSTLSLKAGLRIMELVRWGVEKCWTTARETTLAKGSWGDPAHLTHSTTHRDWACRQTYGNFLIMIKTSYTDSWTHGIPQGIIKNYLVLAETISHSNNFHTQTYTFQ